MIETKTNELFGTIEYFGTNKLSETNEFNEDNKFDKFDKNEEFNIEKKTNEEMIIPEYREENFDPLPPVTENKPKVEPKQPLNYWPCIWRSTLLPGLGQYHIDRKAKALLYYASVLTTGIMSYHYFNKSEQTYQNYLKGTNTIAVTKLYDDYLLQNQLANGFIYITIGLWVYNILDVILDVAWENSQIDEYNNRLSLDLYHKRISYHVVNKKF